MVARVRLEKALRSSEMRVERGKKRKMKNDCVMMKWELIVFGRVGQKYLDLNHEAKLFPVGPSTRSLSALYFQQ